MKLQLWKVSNIMDKSKKKLRPILTENLAYWYFRLNGFLTIPNFVVHPDFGIEQRTEVDMPQMMPGSIRASMHPGSIPPSGQFQTPKAQVFPHM